MKSAGLLLDPEAPSGSLAAWLLVLKQPPTSLPDSIARWARHRSLDALFEDSELTPASSACLADAPEALACLLELGADPDILDAGGWSPLHWCAQSSRPRCARILLERGADPDIRSQDEPATALHFTATSGCRETAALLRSWGASCQTVDEATGATPAHWACHDIAWHQSTASPVPGLDAFGRGPFHWAIRQACGESQAMAACRHWADVGCEFFCPDSLGMDPSACALARGFFDCFSFVASLRESARLIRAIPRTHAVDSRSEPSRL